VKLRHAAPFALFLAMSGAGILLAQKLKELKPASSVKDIPIEKDIEIGRQAAQEVPKQMPVIENATIQPVIDRMIRNLTADGRAGEYPYSIKLVYENSINAFAFPGGAMFIHTGLIQQADNEEQVAGVLAHEVSHVALRHGMANMARAQKAQMAAGIGGALAGIFLGGGALGSLAQAGIGIGTQSVMMKYSRGAENEADLFGARLMNAAGYNPIEMARFFEKLEAQSGPGSAMEEFFASHPNPGNRVKSVEQEIQLLPRNEYRASRQEEFLRAKTAIASIKAPPKPKQQPARGGGGGGQVSQAPGGMQRYTGQSFAMDFPQGWQVMGTQGMPDNVTLAPRDAVKQTQNGTQVGLGVIVSLANSAGELRRSTEAALRDIQQGNPGLQVGQSRQLNVGGMPGILTQLSMESPFGGMETIYFVTADRGQFLWTAAFITPDQQLQKAQPVFERMIRSVQFAK
jgi:Zn-dependent protease with chaperone function